MANGEQTSLRVRRTGLIASFLGGAGAQMTQGHTILLVDDEPMVLRALQRALSEEPYRVLVASSGDEALLLLEREQIDVVVTDERMPGLGGVRLLELAASISPATKRLIMTGGASSSDAVASGLAVRCLRKPCAGQDLVAAIREALATAEAAQPPETVDVGVGAP